MAGWDLDFDVALDDIDLARDCFRILRRTCARHHLRFTYYEERRNDSRVHYMLVFDGRPSQLGLVSLPPEAGHPTLGRSVPEEGVSTGAQIASAVPARVPG